LFIVGGIWNFVVAAPMFLISFFVVSEFKGASLMYYQGFLCAVILFGIGYILVGLDPNKNHAIVLLGGMGKIMVFIFFLAYYIPGHIKLYQLIIGAGDLIFALLFFRFLIWSNSTGQTSVK